MDSPSSNQNHNNLASRHGLLALSLGALGVVFGDIGTSPLYAVRECFHGQHAIALNPTNILGVLSLVFWSLTVVITVKYVGFIMKADNRGEGGIFALLALLLGTKNRMSQRKKTLVILAAVFGATLLYGDGIITPAISVLSAVEGLEVATGAAKPFIAPVTCLILFGLFSMQKHGTESIGRLFGPIMVVWFGTIAFLGLISIAQTPLVLRALNPWYGVQFFIINHWHGIVVLGSVVLCITGGEALYADMGHFNPKAIRFSWIIMVYPALILNYYGQGAILLTSPQAAFNPFYALVPKVLLYPSVALATAATIIASQAMISGVFSLTQQAIQLGYLPRLRIIHTSAQTRGQIYMPEVNWALMLGCLGLVLAFQQSSRLAGAYGIAVTATMGITSILYFFVVTQRWEWSLAKAVPLVGLFLLFDLSFLGANLFKIFDGGWFTLGVALVLAISMTTWKEGRKALGQVIGSLRLPVDLFIADVARTKPYRIPGTAVFMSVSPVGVPGALMHHFKLNQVLHNTIVFLSILVEEIPRVDSGNRLNLENLGEGFYRLTSHYGFMETPNVPRIMNQARELGLETDPSTTTFILGRETLLTTGKSGMGKWRKVLFSMMSRNAMNPTNYFKLPPNRVIEIGAQVEI
ncbi:MAG: potassium transporter Kup [Deltaproteobacteria bacterium RBG_13_43_22]|nr:MAG: potassium transporter Kup [Deltaproteobacteria bacterium RBG_13_43_22]